MQLHETDRRRCKKRSKTRDTSAGGMPGPESATSSSAPGSTAAPTPHPAMHCVAPRPHHRSSASEGAGRAGEAVGRRDTQDPLPPTITTQRKAAQLKVPPWQDPVGGPGQGRRLASQTEKAIGDHPTRRHAAGAGSSTRSWPPPGDSTSPGGQPARVRVPLMWTCDVDVVTTVTRFGPGWECQPAWPPGRWSGGSRGSPLGAL